MNSKPGREAAFALLLEKLLDDLEPGEKRKIPVKELLRVFRLMENNLQSAALTINFNAKDWFEFDNPYDTYTQMYERALDKGKMVLKSTPLNDATARAEVDNQMSFPTAWAGTQSPQPQRNSSPGLRPGRQGVDRIMRQMDTGSLIPAGNPKDKAFHSSEQHFNPHTKQIFLGLNYGRRPSGSAWNFGRSHIVFKDDLKPRCFFYGGDTFMHRGGGKRAEQVQYAFDNLGAIFGSNHNGSFILRDQIFRSCYKGQMLDDVENLDTCKFSLLEAHFFGELRFRDHADFLVLSSKDVKDARLWPQVLENARRFCNRHDIKLFQTG